MEALGSDQDMHGISRQAHMLLGLTSTITNNPHVVVSAALTCTSADGCDAAAA